MGMVYDRPEELADLAEVSMLVHELFKNDTEAAKEWMDEPNELLFHSTPYEVCVSGEAEHLINWLRGRLGK